jgi:hypothetical protein
MSLIVANVEYLEATPFLVAIFYRDGQAADKIVTPFISYENALERIKGLASEHHETSFELFTRDADLYKLTLDIAGISGHIKHWSDVSETAYELSEDDEIMYDLYEIKPIVEKPKPSRFRRFLVSLLDRITNKLRGDYEWQK